MEVIAETSFEVTSNAQTYLWEGHGMKIHIPQDSLPADHQQCVIKIKASLLGLYTLPADCEMVSGVYWIYCPLKLSKHAVLELQHCGTQIRELSFVRAECTQENLPYIFRRVKGGKFSKHSSHGSISMARFSSWSIVQMFSSSFVPQYLAQVYYASTALNIWKVFFAMRRNLDLENMVHRSWCEYILFCIAVAVTYPSIQAHATPILVTCNLEWMDWGYIRLVGT